MDTIITPTQGSESVISQIEERRKLSFGELWNMNFGMLGIQFGWGLQMANMAAIYSKLGAHPDSIPILGLAGPITGLVIQPIIGAMSDRTWHPKYGRRRPYFTIGAILASIVLFIMPDSPKIWVAALLLWLLDAAVNTTQEPFRAFVADKLPLEQRAAGFLMQSAFIGLGAFLANMLPYLFDHVLHIHGEASNKVALSVMYSFRIGAFAFILSVLWTVFKTPEAPPEDMVAFEEHRRRTRGFEAGIAEIWHALVNMPTTMRQLFWVQFATWFGLTCGWGLFTLAVAKNVFHTLSAQGPVFDHATEWAGVCGAVNSVVTFLVAPLMPKLSERIGRPKLHAFALLLGAVGMFSLGIIHDKNMLLVAEVASGIAWASIIALPYAMLSVALPPERTGVYMGIFNFFIVLPQTVYSLGMPFVIKNIFHEDPVMPMFVGAACFAIAGVLGFAVREIAPVSALEPATEPA